MSAPPDGGKPRARAHDGRRAEQSRDWLPPATEPRRRRAGVQAAFSRAVLAAIHKNVNQRVSDLARRPQGSRVKAIAPDSAATTKHAVDRPGDANGKTADPMPERLRIIGLDDEMEMVVLNTELKDPKAPARGHGEGVADGGKRTVGAQAPDGLAGAQRDVQRVRRAVRRPRAVRDARPATRRELPAGTGAPTAPCARRRQRELQAPRHLVWATIAG